MHVSRSETYIASGHKDTSIKLWNAKTKEQVWKIQDAHSDPVACVRVTPDENYVVSTSKDDTIKIWDIRKEKLL
jgi:WD40 repeat protein